MIIPYIYMMHFCKKKKNYNFNNIIHNDLISSCLILGIIYCGNTALCKCKYGFKNNGIKYYLKEKYIFYIHFYS